MSTVLTLDLTEEKLFDMNFAPKMRDGDVITAIQDVEAFYDQELTQSASAVIECSDFSTSGQVLQFLISDLGAVKNTQFFIRARVVTTSDPLLVGRGILVISS